MNKRYHNDRCITLILHLFVVSCSPVITQYTSTVPLHGSANVICFDGETQEAPLEVLVLRRGGNTILSLSRNEDTSKYILNPGNYTVTLFNATVNDSGQYTCESADLTFSTHTFQTTVTVFASPQVVLISSTHNTVDELTTEEVTCEVPRVYPSNSLTFCLKSGESEHNSESVEYETNNDGTLMARSRHNVILRRENNVNKLRCIVFYFGLTFNSTLESTDLGVIVHFFPQINEMTTPTLNVLVLNQVKEFKCTTDSLNPVEKFFSMRWKRGTSQNSNDITSFDDSQYAAADGEYEGKIITSSYTFTVTKEDDNAYVTCVPRWREENRIVSISHLAQSQQLSVYYPHMVSLYGCGVQNEGTTCYLICQAIGGKPPTVLSYNWMFKYKFASVFRDLHSYERVLELRNLSSRDAGMYFCQAVNAGGTANATLEVLVKHAPEALDLDNNSTNRKTYFTKLGSTITLYLTVTSYPRPDFVWRKDQILLPNEMELLSEDKTKAKLTLHNVSANNYGEYVIDVSNGVDGSKVYFIVLRKYGKPEQPHGLRIESLSFREIVISFLPGSDNGFPQSISTEISLVSENSQVEVGQQIINPIYNERVEVQISKNINKKSSYSIRLVADNDFEGGMPSVSERINATTRDIVTLDDTMLVLTESQDVMKLSWPEPKGEYTSVVIEQCTARDENCICIDVTNSTRTTLPKSNYTVFSLVVKQDRDIVIDERFKADFSNEARAKRENGRAGEIIGGVLAFGALCGIVLITIIILWRKRQGRNQQHHNPYMQPEPQRNDTAPNSIYVELNPTNKYENQEIFRKHKTAKCDVTREELTFEALIYSGSYASTYKGMFENNSCAIKVLRDDIVPCNAADMGWILCQIRALQAVLKHENIVWLLACTDSVRRIKDTCLVTALEDNGDLKTYLTEKMEGMYENTSNLQNKIIQHITFALQITNGMLHLAQQKQMEILHFELSARHVLVSSDYTCKVTNFASADDVKDRQRSYMNAEDCPIIPWLAPECIVSVDEHTTASDVWSFGVLLYEISTNGANPYGNITTDEIGAFVLDGNQMEAPPRSTHLFHIMKQCWQFNPDDRPLWKSLQSTLTKEREKYIKGASDYEILNF